MTSGQPTPTITWIHNGRTALTSGGRFQIVDSGTLIISHVQVTDCMPTRQLMSTLEHCLTSYTYSHICTNGLQCENPKLNGVTSVLTIRSYEIIATLLTVDYMVMICVMPLSRSFDDLKFGRYDKCSRSVKDAENRQRTTLSHEP